MELNQGQQKRLLFGFSSDLFKRKIFKKKKKNVKRHKNYGNVSAFSLKKLDIVIMT